MAVCRPSKIGYKQCNNGNLPDRRGAGRHWNDKGAWRMNVGMRVRGGLLAALIMVGVPVPPRWWRALVSAPAAAQTAASIAVEGNRRVDVETIRSYFKPGPGGRLEQAQIDDGLKALIETGLFQDVQINQAGGRLVVIVVENPGDRPHRLRRQQEGQGRAAFGRNPVQAARDAVPPDGSVRRPAHRRNLSPFRPL